MRCAFALGFSEFVNHPMSPIRITTPRTANTHFPVRLPFMPIRQRHRAFRAMFFWGTGGDNTPFSTPPRPLPGAQDKLLLARMKQHCGHSWRRQRGHSYQPRAPALGWYEAGLWPESKAAGGSNPSASTEVARIWLLIYKRRPMGKSLNLRRILSCASLPAAAALGLVIHQLWRIVKATDP